MVQRKMRMVCTWRRKKRHEITKEKKLLQHRDNGIVVKFSFYGKEHPTQYAECNWLRYMKCQL